MFSKWTMIILVVILIAVVIAYLTGKKSVHDEILINASPEKVWSVLTNTNVYSSWNPVMKLLEGELAEGNTVKYQFTQSTESVYTISARVKEMIPQEFLNQVGGMPVFLTFNHRYILNSTNEGTKLIIHEDYQGIGVHFWNPQPVEEAYKKLNSALKKHVESLH
jgi:hypothetical protein